MRFDKILKAEDKKEKEMQELKEKNAKTYAMNNNADLADIANSMFGFDKIITKDGMPSENISSENAIKPTSIPLKEGERFSTQELFGNQEKNNLQENAPDLERIENLLSSYRSPSALPKNNVPLKNMPSELDEFNKRLAESQLKDRENIINAEKTDAWSQVGGNLIDALSKFSNASGQMRVGAPNVNIQSSSAAEILEKSPVGKNMRADAKDRTQQLLEEYKRATAGKLTEKDRALLNLKRKELETKANKKDNILSKGQLERDKEFVKKVMVPWVDEGGRGFIESNIQTLKEAEEALEKSSKEDILPLTGKARGLFSSIAGQFGPGAETTNLQARIDNINAKSLREILGGQFAMLEGQQLLERGFDKYADPEENIKRISDLRKAMEKALIAKDKSVQEFSEQGTLSESKPMFSPGEIKPDSIDDSKKTKTINGKTYRKVEGGWEEV